MDKDNSTFLEWPEFSKVISDREIMKMLDRDHDGRISRKELITAIDVLNSTYPGSGKSKEPEQDEKEEEFGKKGESEYDGDYNNESDSNDNFN